MSIFRLIGKFETAYNYLLGLLILTIFITLGFLLFQSWVNTNQIRGISSQNKTLSEQNNSLSEENRRLNRCMVQLLALYTQTGQPILVEDLDKCIIASQQASRDQGTPTNSTQSLEPGSIRTDQSPDSPQPIPPPATPPPPAEEEPPPEEECAINLLGICIV